jgi:hypothetical protein
MEKTNFMLYSDKLALIDELCPGNMRCPIFIMINLPFLSLLTCMIIYQHFKDLPKDLRPFGW